MAFPCLGCLLIVLLRGHRLVWAASAPSYVRRVGGVSVPARGTLTLQLGANCSGLRQPGRDGAHGKKDRKLVEKRKPTTKNKKGTAQARKQQTENEPTHTRKPNHKQNTIRLDTVLLSTFASHLSLTPCKFVFRVCVGLFSVYCFRVFAVILIFSVGAVSIGPSQL